MSDVLDDLSNLSNRDLVRLIEDIRKMRDELAELRIKRDKLQSATGKVVELRKGLLEDIAKTDEIEQDIAAALEGNTEKESKTDKEK